MEGSREKFGREVADWEEAFRSLEKKGYTVRGLLGQGAFSKVYRVEKRGSDKGIACKISKNTALIRREVRILKGLKHSLFPEYYESWQEGGLGFIFMEQVKGENLSRLLKSGKAFSVCQTAEIGMELAEGLLYLHERQQAVLFRDVKPENIMLREDGRIKLLDFGCACMEGEDGATRAGTPGFAAPEQLAEGGKQSRLCDVYGLGRTLQELLWAGERQSEKMCEQESRNKRQIRRRNQGEGFRAHRDRRRLEKLLAACVEEEPSARPADMRVVMAALMPFCAPASAGRPQGSGDFWQKGVVCEKNIWKSTCKTS